MGDQISCNCTVVDLSGRYKYATKTTPSETFIQDIGRVTGIDKEVATIYVGKYLDTKDIVDSINEELKKKRIYF